MVHSYDQQAWPLRIGTALAFFVKSGLVSVVGIVGVQRTWLTLRKKAMFVAAIDSMFAVLNHPTSLFNADMICHAKTVLVFAFVSWLLPALVIFAPATLSVRARVTDMAEFGSVPTTKFSSGISWANYGGVGYIVGPSSWAHRVFA